MQQLPLILTRAPLQSSMVHKSLDSPGTSLPSLAETKVSEPMERGGGAPCLNGDTEQRLGSGAHIACYGGHSTGGRGQEHRRGTQEEEDQGCSAQNHYTEHLSITCLVYFNLKKQDFNITLSGYNSFFFFWKNGLGKVHTLALRACITATCIWCALVHCGAIHS